MITLMFSVFLFWGALGSLGSIESIELIESIESLGLIESSRSLESFENLHINNLYAIDSWTDDYGMDRYLTNWDTFMKEQYLLKNRDITCLGYEAAYQSLENMLDFPQLCTYEDKWYIEYLKDPKITGEGYWERLEPLIIKDIEIVKNDLESVLSPIRTNEILEFHYYYY